jgi:D-alanyl-D-alanine carboxypeptidase
MAIYDVNGNVLYEGGVDPSFTDAECRAAFMSEVNRKAASIGMANSSFIRPAGDSGTAQTTAADMALLTLVASGYKEMAEVWSKNSYTFVPRNKTTSVTVNTTVANAALEAAYPILGGKTGSYAGKRALACLCSVDGTQVVGYIADATSDAARFSAMKQLMDIAATVLGGGTNADTVTDALEAVALKVPTYYPLNYEGQTPAVLYSQSGSASIVPASTAKLITALTMLDWVDDINETFAFVSGDLIGGSGNIGSAGDVISFKDALYAMMLPSSNMSAHAVARVVGRKILTRNG